MADPIDDRMRTLSARIAAAKDQLAKRADFEDDEVGDILATINEDFDRSPTRTRPPRTPPTTASRRGW